MDTATTPKQGPQNKLGVTLGVTFDSRKVKALRCNDFRGQFDSPHLHQTALHRGYCCTLDDRKVMMQEWADYLDKLKAGAEVIPLNQSAA